MWELSYFPGPPPIWSGFHLDIKLWGGTSHHASPTTNQQKQLNLIPVAILYSCRTPKRSGNKGTVTVDPASWEASLPKLQVFDIFPTKMSGIFGPENVPGFKCMVLGGRVFFGVGCFFVFRVAVFHWIILKTSLGKKSSEIWMGTNTCKCSSSSIFNRSMFCECIWDSRWFTWKFGCKALRNITIVCLEVLDVLYTCNIRHLQSSTGMAWQFLIASWWVLLLRAWHLTSPGLKTVQTKPNRSPYMDIMDGMGNGKSFRALQILKRTFSGSFWHKSGHTNKHWMVWAKKRVTFKAGQLAHSSPPIHRAFLYRMDSRAHFRANLRLRPYVSARRRDFPLPPCFGATFFRRGTRWMWCHCGTNVGITLMHKKSRLPHGAELSGIAKWQKVICIYSDNHVKIPIPDSTKEL